MHIPTISCIQKLDSFLEGKQTTALISLKEEFNEYFWTSLVQFTLILALLFNRRISGEQEPTLLADYENKQCIQD